MPLRSTLSRRRPQISARPDQPDIVPCPRRCRSHRPSPAQTFDAERSSLIPGWIFQHTVDHAAVNSQRLTRDIGCVVRRERTPPNHVLCSSQSTEGHRPGSLISGVLILKNGADIPASMKPGQRHLLECRTDPTPSTYAESMPERRPWLRRKRRCSGWGECQQWKPC